MTNGYANYRSASRRRLFRDPERGWIGGVCAGIANYLAVPVFWVRLLAVLPMFSPLLPLVVICYVIAVLRIPPLPDEPLENSDEQEFLRSLSAAPSNTFGDLRHRMRDLEYRLRRMEAYVTSAEFEFDQGMKSDD